LVRTIAGFTFRVITRWNWPIAGGQGSVETGFTHVMFCPPAPETAVEFDPTLGHLLGPWVDGQTAVFREDLTDGDGVLRHYAIYELSPLTPGHQISARSSGDVVR
jgi:hypothetical protein